MTARRSEIERFRREQELLRVLAIVILSGFAIVEAVSFLARIGYAATIVIGGLFVAFLVLPVVAKLNERLPLWAALAFVCVSVLVILAFALYVVLPNALEQLLAFIHDIPALEAQAQRIVNDPASPLLARLPPLVRSEVQRLPSFVAAYVQRESGPLSLMAMSLARSLVATAALVIAIPVVAIYMLAEGEAIKRTLLSFLPERAGAPTIELLAALQTVVGGFIRGQLLVAAVVGTLVALLLTALGVPYAVLIGFSAGILDVIPYIGAVAGYLPAALIALIVNGPMHALYVTIGFITINQLEGHVISPRIVSGTVGITPLTVIVALLVGGELYGLPGLVVAVPVAGALRVVLEFARAKRSVRPCEVQPALTAGPRSEGAETVAMR